MLRAVALVACCLLPGAVVHAQSSFSAVQTAGRFNRIQVIVAVADLNGDGRDDIIAGAQPNDGSETAEDRLDKPPVRGVARDP